MSFLIILAGIFAVVPIQTKRLSPVNWLVLSDVLIWEIIVSGLLLNHQLFLIHSEFQSPHYMEMFIDAVEM